MKNSPFYTIGITLCLMFFSTQAQAINCVTASKITLLQKSAPYQQAIFKHARTHRVDINLVRSVIAMESCYNPKALSPKGAQGLMQLIPATAERFGVSDSYSPDQNISAGTRYLRFLLDRYDGNVSHAIAAYNAGEGRVDQYNGIPPYKETQAYVKNVLATYKKLSPPPAKKNTPKAIVKKKPPGKPGREGLAELKKRAPQLFKQ